MARAYACDRCGKLFKSKDLNYHVDVILECNTRYPLAFGRSDSNDALQICPKCRASFQKWWDDGAVNKTTDPQYKYVTTLYEAPEEAEDETDN